MSATAPGQSSCGDEKRILKNENRPEASWAIQHLMIERLQKIISRAGIASRRHAEQLILSGAVTVNGQVITELGTKADAARDHITVCPRVVRLESDGRQGYFAFHKPRQVVSTLNDPEGRPCLGPYLRTHRGRLFPVGRLEFDARAGRTHVPYPQHPR